MNKFISCLSLLLCLIFPAAQGQQSKYYISAPTDLKEVGMNKVLCMKNGNTMLFHFEPRKHVVVKVFDSLHKEIASQKHLCNVLDINVFETSVFKGLYDINGDAVLFVEQVHANKRVLVRVRFNAVNGEIIDETVPAESQSMLKPASFYVMKEKTSDNYSILSCTDVPQFKECKVSVTYYNNRHETLREVQIPVDTKNYDYVNIVGAESQVSGTCISIGLTKLVTNETSHDASDNINTANVYDHVLMMAYIPANSSEVRAKQIDLSTELYPYYTNFTYNPFAQSLNVLLLSYKEFMQRRGLESQPIAQKASMIFTLDEASMSLKYNWIKNHFANIYYKQQTDSTKLFEGLPLKLFTNNNGLSTLIYQSYSQYSDVETNARANVYDSYFGKICITQCDDDGNELWGIVLPQSQYLMSYKHYYHADELSKRWQNQQMFDDLPAQVYNRQFVSLNAYTFNKDYYIIFNDNNSNFSNSMAHPGDTVYSFATTNACYYKMDKKKEITKSYLFGEPVPGEYNSSFIEGADFDEQKGTYVTLLQCRKDNETKLCVAWCQLR